MGFILEHVDDPVVILNKYKTYLKENGIIFISVPNAKSLHRLIGFEAGLLDDMYKLSVHDLELGHKRYFDLEKIKDLISNSNLDVKNCFGLMLKPITGDQMQKLGWDSTIFDALVKIGHTYPELSNCIYLEVGFK
jgi:2-polyprenyl-3-methyl-5-hydroxy-6-metoxy-1,4-benzoquinol methylase